MKNMDNHKNTENEKIVFYENGNEIENIYLTKANILLEALPYIKEYFNKIVVIKIGGSMMENDMIMKSVLDDIILMKYVGIKVIIVHGGGKQITQLMNEKKVKVEFIDGLRVTDKDSIEIVKMVLMGSINSKIVSFLNMHGKIAVGLSGNDGNFISCKKKIYFKDGKELDLGFVGDIINIDTRFVNNILDGGYIPVIASLGADSNGNIYNINADTCASKTASSIGALKMIILTDVDGIYFSNVSNVENKLVSKISVDKCEELINLGYINKGMIPKVKACMESLKNGVLRTHILNGTIKHSILIEIFTDKGIGTMIY